MRADLPSPVAESGFTFPDETWARVIYDVVVAYHERRLSLERLVTSLIPLYFGRVASLIFETRELTTDQAEAFVDRQARAFELSKPYLVDRWSTAPSDEEARAGNAAGGGGPGAGDRRTLRHPESRSARSAAGTSG